MSVEDTRLRDQLREVDFNRPIERITVMAYGDSGSGKTRFLGTFPRPIILADATEGGWTTIQTMPDEDRWEAHVMPRVIPIERPADMLKAHRQIEAEVKARPGSILTIGIDSVTFLGDLYLNVIQREFEVKARDGGKGFDPRQVYGKLMVMLRDLMIRMHSIPKVHVVWTALAKEPDEPGRDGGILLAGQTRGKAPAACSLWTYLRSEMDGDDVAFRAHNARFGPFPARGRFAKLLPAEMEPKFSIIDKALNLRTPRESKTVVQVPRRVVAK